MDNDYYKVVAAGTRMAVKDGANTIIIECTDGVNAQHYCTLLNKAYKSGFKHGYKEAGKSKDR